MQPSKDPKVRREKAKAKYQQMKSMGLCVSCGKPAAKGRVRCLDCLESVSVASLVCKSEMSDEAKKKARKRATELQRIHYRERKAEGVCVECGKPTVDGLTRCQRCRVRHNDRMKQYVEPKTKKKEWIAQGLCMLCGKECEKGYKLCSEHRAKAREAAKKARKKRS